MTSDEDIILSNDVVEKIIECQSDLVDSTELIDDALDTNLDTGHPNRIKEDTIYAVELAISGGSPDTNIPAHELAHSLMYTISNFQPGMGDTLIEWGASDDLLELISRLKYKYGDQIDDPIYRDVQGENYWSRVSTDIVLRNKDNIPGLNHSITIGVDEEVKITTSLQSNLDLIGVLLGEEVDAIEQLGQQAAKNISLESIDGLREKLDQIEESVKEHHPEFEEDA